MAQFVRGPLGSRPPGRLQIEFGYDGNFRSEEARASSSTPACASASTPRPRASAPSPASPSASARLGGEAAPER